MSMRLGEQVVVLEQDAPTGAEDEYGNPVTGKAWVEIHWCLIVPSYATAPTNRNC